MKRIVVGNWKMYLERPDEAKRLAVALKRRARSFGGATVVVAPPFLLLSTVAAVVGKSSALRLGAQSVSPQRDAKHTGDVSAAMVKHLGAAYVIVGHSERRAMGESNAVVRQELERAGEAGLTAILCVGEHERDQAGAHFAYIKEQLTSAIVAKSNPKLIVAYEPVWAIGKTAGDAMKPQELQEMVIFIRKTLADILGRAPALKVPILYGGSVESANAKQLIGEGGVAGFLVGHASVDAKEFIEIIHACR